MRLTNHDKIKKQRNNIHNTKKAIVLVETNNLVMRSSRNDARRSIYTQLELRDAFPLTTRQELIPIHD